MQKQQLNHLPTAYIRLACGVGGMLIILALLFAYSPSKSVRANDNDINLATSKYPFIVGTRLNSCSLCHTSAPALNPYGLAYFNNGRSLAAFGLIENIDSDGDGFTNIQEINNLYFPGNPNDHPPASTSTPTQTSTSMPPTPTRTSTSIPPTPTRTNTSVPPTPTRTSTSVPPTPTQTSTSVPPTPTRTNTSIPPTQTSTNTALPSTPTATGTLIPPTSTATGTPLPPTATPTNNTPTPTSTSLPPSPTEPPPTPIEPTPTQITPPILDLDICWVDITSRVQLDTHNSVMFSVAISKHNDVVGKGIAMISGTQNGVVIYKETQIVELDDAHECHWYTFPSYPPTQVGRIRWTVQLVGGDPNEDTRNATTRVYRSTHDGRDRR